MSAWRTLKVVVAFTLLIPLLKPTSVEAQALRFQPQGARAAGQGNAFAAEADDASAIHYNPAGLSQAAGVQSVVGVNIVGGAVEFKNQSGLESRGDFNGSINWPPPSHFYLSANLGVMGLSGLSSATLGIGVTSPFGLNTRYPVDGPFNTAATSAAMPLIAIKPTIAYKIHEDLSVGVSADVYTFAGFLGEGHVEKRLIWPGGLGIPAGASFEFSSKGTGAGVTGSLLYIPFRNTKGKPLVSIGFVYASQAVLPLDGSFLVNGDKVADASTTLVLPQVYRGAVALWPVRNLDREWKMEVDIEYVAWKSVKHFDVRLSNGVVLSQPQDWKSVFVLSVGTEYKWLSPRWLSDWEIAARSGYTYTGDPVPDRTFNPGIISLPAHTLSLGVGLLCQGTGKFLVVIPCSGKSALWPKGIGLDLAYQEWFYEARAVSGNLNPTVDGVYDAFVHLGAFSFRFLF